MTKKYKAQIVGLGQIGLMYDFDPKRETPSSHTLAFQMHPEIEVDAAMDLQAGQGKYLHRFAPGAHFYTDLLTMLSNRSTDIVSICTPPKGRTELIKSIVDLSDAKVIFCEKPVANDIDEAIEILSFVRKRNCLFIPNLSRRWNSGIQRVRETILNRQLGALKKIHVSYTRGIYNTGSHVFDLLRYFAGSINSVRVVNRVTTSSDREGEPSFSFTFDIGEEVKGYAEAFNDQYYYMFEIELYFDLGKIEIVRSGDEIRYYEVGDHPLFTGFKSLHFKHSENSLLSESNLKNAVDHLVQVLDGKVKPICTIEDGIYPLFVAEALQRSYQKNCSLEKVVVAYE